MRHKRRRMKPQNWKAMVASLAGRTPDGDTGCLWHQQDKMADTSEGVGTQQKGSQSVTGPPNRRFSGDGCHGTR